jgi:hypothetical protein
MKTIITFTFFLITLSVFSQTTREEVVSRTAGGLKLEVLTYSGTGNNEKLIKRTFYGKTPDTYRKDGVNNITSKPTDIIYYGNYKVEWVNKNSIGEPVKALCYGVIKMEKFDNNGKLESTWKITEENGEKDLSENYSRDEKFSMWSLFIASSDVKVDYDSFLQGTLTYTIIP